MKENLKKIGKYLLILLLLISGVAVLALLFLFFVPSASIFGISYISRDKNTFSKAYLTTGISEVKLTNSSYPVRVINSSNEEISVKVHDNTFGYVLTKNKNLTLTSKVNQTTSGAQLEFMVGEPHGLASRSDSYIELRLPKKFATSLTLVNGSADTTIKLENSTTINNFSLQSSSGQVNLSTGKIAGELNLALGRTSFTAGESFDLANASIVAGLTSGTFDTFANTSTIASITINNLGSGRFNINNCNKIVGEKLSESGGKITIKKLNGSAEITAADTNIVIDQASVSSVTIALTKSGSIKFGEVEGSTFSATTNTGDITVSRTTAPFYLESEQGNISVDSAAIISSVTDQAPIRIVNNSGNINLNYSRNADDLDKNFWASVQNNKGRTTINEVKRLDLKITGNGAADVTFFKVDGISNINATGKGSIYVLVPGNHGITDEALLNKFTINFSSESGTASVALTQTSQGAVEETSPVHVGKKEDEPLTQEWEDNVVNISTTAGLLTVRSR